MQAEAGQQIETIVSRKELERRAGNGSFMWGVGNPPAIITGALARAKVPVHVIFSMMKSRPKAVDVAPRLTVAWRQYVDLHGAVRPLPPNALVTSRGHSSGGAKRIHYALMCWSEKPLTIRHGEPFDPGAFRNAGGTRSPVGASQVTALLQRVGDESDQAQYEANFVACLTGSYWVRLIDPVELDTSKLALLKKLTECGMEMWCERVAELLRGPPAYVATETRGALL